MDCHTTQINEGLNGFNNYTYTTATFVMPAINNATPVTINVSNVRPSTGIWAAAGSYLFINGNYLLVVSSTENTITITNPATNTNYTTNQAPGSVIPSNSLVITTGPQGPPVTLPRRSVMCDTSGFTFNVVSSSAYQTLFSGNITNYLTSEGDCIEFDYQVFTTALPGDNAAGLKIVVGGTTLQEITNIGSSANGFRYLWNTVKIIRGSDENTFLYKSEMLFSTDVTAGVTDVKDLNTRQLITVGQAVIVSSVENLSVACLVDIDNGLAGTAGFLNIKFTPYDN